MLRSLGDPIIGNGTTSMKTKKSKAALRDAVLHGDCEQVLAELPDQLVNTIVTSPPYYQQRHYSTKTEVGQETTPEQYVQHLVGIFSEARRVLKDDGTLWLVLGDKYKNGAQLACPGAWRWLFKQTAGSYEAISFGTNRTRCLRR